MWLINCLRNPQRAVVPPSQVLLDLTRDTAAADDALAPGFAAAGGPAELLPRLQEVLRQSALTLNELLRHFWACFRLPLTSRPRLEKLERVHQGLLRQYQKCALLLSWCETPEERPIGTVY